MLAYAILAFALALNISRQSSSCPDDFSKRLAAVKEWSALQAIYEQCPDDGEYGEGLSNTVVVMLADHWTDLPSLARLVSRDPRFKRLVFRHIDSTTDEKDLRRALSNAQTKCPARQKTLCAQIVAELKAAIADL